MSDTIAGLRDAARRQPDDPDTWRRYGDACFRAGLTAEADAAYQRQILVSVNDPMLRRAALALADNRLDVAERILKPHLKASPTDVAAIRMLAELAGRIGRLDDAEALLQRAIELAPGFLAARQNMAMLHLRKRRFAPALDEIAHLIAAEPDNPAFQNLEGVALAQIGDYGDAAERFAEVLAARPKLPRVWLSYGHSLKTMGRQDEAVAAYRAAAALQPRLGEAWWSLANLKAVAFTVQDVEVMEQMLRSENLAAEDRLHLHFALGKAWEDRAEPATAFAHYEQGNRIRAGQLRYDPAPIEALVEASIATLDSAFFAARQGWGDPAPDPIFIVGMPRSGSTLVEQILASHSLVEGTRELADVEMLARTLGAIDGTHPAALAAESPERFAAMGAAYLEATRLHRKSSAPLFIDKMPNNWAFVPLIRLMLPNARIIDTRRSAMACCVSNFRQHYARGQAFSYRLDHLGRYYRAYARFMDHIEIMLPGMVHRVHHEAMVADSEREIRRLLDFLSLPFEPACLRFWETDRPVQTASSEQVRRPINAEGIDSWRTFAPMLAPLREALGDQAEA